MERFLSESGVCDVLHDHDDADRLAGRVDDDLAVAAQCADSTVGAQPTVFEYERRSVGDRAPQGLPDALSVFRVDALVGCWAGTAKGPFTKWLLNGTIHGHYSEKFQFTNDTDATYEPAITISGGTGAFKSVNGKGPERCRTTNGGATLTCTEVLGNRPLIRSE